MVDLNPVLNLILELRASLENGCSVKLSIETYLRKKDSDFSRHLCQWFLAVQHNRDLQSIYVGLSVYRKSLFQLLECGLKGQPIYEPLCQLQEEIALACDQEMEMALQRLPFKLLVPVLGFLFPAYIILLLGPLIKKFLEEISL